MTRRVTTQLANFKSLFLKWNQRINLSGASSAEGVDEHIRDSRHAVPYLEGCGAVIDVGSGGGFPVIITAICLPDVQFTAIEPVHKKHAFLRTAARELGLDNLTALAVRVEDHDRHDYDAATSRATFDLRDWLALGATLVKPGGLIIGFEGVARDDLPKLYERHPYDLDGKQRAIIVHRRLI